MFCIHSVWVHCIVYSYLLDLWLFSRFCSLYKGVRPESYVSLAYKAEITMLHLMKSSALPASTEFMAPGAGTL